MTLNRMLAAARDGVVRPGPALAAEQVRAGAVLVDIRPHAQRVAEGEIPGALVIERNVLEWRLDPRGTRRLPLAGADLRVVLFCSAGYASSLAAHCLRQLGVPHATDLDGGFQAWRAAGLPVTSGGSPPIT